MLFAREKEALLSTPLSTEPETGGTSQGFVDAIQFFRLTEHTYMDMYPTSRRWGCDHWSNYERVLPRTGISGARLGPGE